MNEPYVMPEAEGLEALRWLRDRDWTGGLAVLVSTRPYTGRIDPMWIAVDRVSTGATPYPVKGQIPLHGNGQWSFREVLAVGVLDAGVVNPDFPFPRLIDGDEYRAAERRVAATMAAEEALADG